jgi:ankyrin repeat protein
LISAPFLSKQSTIAQCPNIDATNNGECPRFSLKLISAPYLSKQSTISQCPIVDATNNGECPRFSLVNLLDENGQSPLFAASICGEHDVVECLLTSGTDNNLSENRGHSTFIAYLADRTLRQSFLLIACKCTPVA